MRLEDKGVRVWAANQRHLVRVGLHLCPGHQIIHIALLLEIERRIHRSGGIHADDARLPDVKRLVTIIPQIHMGASLAEKCAAPFLGQVQRADIDRAPGSHVLADEGWVAQNPVGSEHLALA